MIRYTKTDVRKVVKLVEMEARALGLIAENHHISYSGGNPSNGISADLSVYAVNEDGHRNAVRVDFLPEFTYKSTAREQFKTLEAVHNVLVAVYSDTVDFDTVSGYAFTTNTPEP
jgi:hypothetical protein